VNTKRVLFLILVLVVLAAVVWFALGRQDQAGLPNPASVFCADQGGTLEIRTDSSGNQYGMCVFSDGRECEEWALFQDGICQPYSG
jgi:putative hemolysin